VAKTTGAGSTQADCCRPCDTGGAVKQLTGLAGVAAEHWRARVQHYLPLIGRVLDQSERRVLRGQAVPADEKLVSLVEPHADIVKGARDVQYGHKLNLITGKSGLILDLVIEAVRDFGGSRFERRPDVRFCGTSLQLTNQRGEDGVKPGHDEAGGACQPASC
jgi:hypothetical protein